MVAVCSPPPLRRLRWSLSQRVRAGCRSCSSTGHASSRDLFIKTSGARRRDETFVASWIKHVEGALARLSSGGVAGELRGVCCAAWMRWGRCLCLTGKSAP